MAESNEIFNHAQSLQASPAGLKSNLYQLGDGCCSPQSSGSFLSSASTEHASNLSPSLEKNSSYESWNSWHEEDPVAVQPIGEIPCNLQSVMDAEEELSSIFRPKAKKLNVRPSASGNQNIMRPSVQSTKASPVRQRTIPQAYERSKTLNFDVPSRPENPQGKEDFEKEVNEYPCVYSSEINKMN